MAQFDSYGDGNATLQDLHQFLFSDGTQLKNIKAQNVWDYINGKMDIESAVGNELSSRNIDETLKEVAIPLISKDSGGNVTYESGFNIHSTQGLGTSVELPFSVPSGYKIIPMNHVLYWNIDSGLQLSDSSVPQNLKVNLRWSEGGNIVDFAANGAPTNLVDGGSQWVDIEQFFDGIKSVQWFYGNRKGNENNEIQVFATPSLMFGQGVSLQMACEQNPFAAQSEFENNLNNGAELVLRVKYYQFSTDRIGT